MKRYAHWCCLLWIAITLIIPQTAVVADVHTASAGECRLTASHQQPVPLVGETSLIGLIKVENQPEKTPEGSPDLQAAAKALAFTACSLSTRGKIDWAASLPASPVSTLPPGCGPPQGN